VRSQPIEIIKALAFALATLAATGALVVAGLNESALAAVAATQAPNSSK